MTDYESFIKMLQKADIKYRHYDDGIDYHVSLAMGSMFKNDDLYATFVFNKKTGDLIIYYPPI